MDKKLQNKLIEKYPIIFKECGGDIRQTCMGWGLTCGDGWFNLLDQMCADITKMIGNRKIEVVALQVKEKFGGLRFYYSMITPPASLVQELDFMIRQFMFSRKLGKQYWKVANLRKVFWKSIYDKISDRIEQAEVDSYKTCETCGEPGNARGGGWIRTLCETCHSVKC